MFAETARRLGLTERLAQVVPGALEMPAATVPLPRRQTGTAANYLWWLQRPAALRSLPIPSEKLEFLQRY